MHYWRVYSPGEDRRLDVSGTAGDFAEAKYAVGVAVRELRERFGPLPDDLVRAYASEDCENPIVYQHLPHHPRMRLRATRPS